MTAPATTQSAAPRPTGPRGCPGERCSSGPAPSSSIYDDRSGSKHALGNFQHVFDPAVERSPGQSKVIYHGDVVFRGTGTFGQAVPSPDGRWVLVTWPTADQWVFVRPGTRRIVGVSRISSQFGGFPRVEGWCCAR